MCSKTIEWIIYNESWLTVLISLSSVLITTILTFWIIRQTSRISKQQTEQQAMFNKQQTEQQAMFNKQQVELQKRQIQLDTFEYKNNIYHAIYSIFQLTGEIQDSFQYVKYNEKSFEQLHGLFGIYLDEFKIDSKDFMWLLKQAEYILPENIVPSIRKIRLNFNCLTGDFAKFGVFPEILLPEEFEKEKLKLIHHVYSMCEQINSHLLFIESVMPAELSIANLSK